MNYFFIICGAFALVSSIIYSVFSKKGVSNAVPLISYGVILGAYLFLCGGLLNMLLNQFQHELSTYINIFMISITSLSLVSSIALILFSFIKNSRASEMFFNFFAIGATAVTAALTINCCVSNTDYLYLLAFVPFGWIMPVVMSGALLDVSKRSSFVKLLMAYIFLTVLCVIGLVMLFMASAKSGVVNYQLFVIAVPVAYIAVIGIVCAVFKYRKEAK